MAEDRVAVVQRVKAANDIVDVVGGYVTLRPVGAKFMGCVPSTTITILRSAWIRAGRTTAAGPAAKIGDVFTFIQEHEKVSFPEALELLAQRAGITLEKTGDSQQNAGRAFMLDVMRWAAEQFQRCLLDATVAEPARVYLGQRQLTGETVRRFQLGFAPGDGNWLVQLARRGEPVVGDSGAGGADRETFGRYWLLRSFSRPGDVSDPRSAGASRGVWRADFAVVALGGASGQIL